MDGGFDLIRFDGGAPEGGPGGSIDARSRFFGAWLFGIARGTNFFGMRIWSFGLMRFDPFELSLCLLLLWDHDLFMIRIFFFRILISKVSRSGGYSFFQRLSGKTFLCQRSLLHKNIFYKARIWKINPGRKVLVNTKIQYCTITNICPET